MYSFVLHVSFHSVSLVHSYRLNSFFLISRRPLLQNFCAVCSGGVFLTPATNAAYPQRICLFLLGLAPFLVASALVPFRTKRKSGWGICGSSFGVFCCVWWFLRFSGLLLVHGHSVMYLFGFYHFYFCQDRASGNIGHTRRKKKFSYVQTPDIL